MLRSPAADRLFDELDGRELSVAGTACRIVVYGVFDVAGRRWVQVSLDGARYAVLTLRLTPSETSSEAVRELSSWLLNPSETENVLPHVA